MISHCKVPLCYNKGNNWKIDKYCGQGFDGAEVLQRTLSSRGSHVFPLYESNKKKKFVSLYITVQTQTRFLTLTPRSLCSHFRVLEITPLVLNHSDDDDIDDNTLPKATHGASDLGRICSRSAWWQNLSSCCCNALLFDKAF